MNYLLESDSPFNRKPVKIALTPNKVEPDMFPFCYVHVRHDCFVVEKDDTRLLSFGITRFVPIIVIDNCYCIFLTAFFSDAMLTQLNKWINGGNSSGRTGLFYSVAFRDTGKLADVVSRQCYASSRANKSKQRYPWLLLPMFATVCHC